MATAPKPLNWIDAFASTKEIADAYVETKQLLLAAQEHVDKLKEMLKHDEELLSEEFIQENIKTLRHPQGNITIKNNVFGSIKKEDDEKTDDAKARVLPIIEQAIKDDPEFAGCISYEPTLNSKILGEKIRKKRDYAMAVWQSEPTQGKEFTPSLYLPESLINVLNVSQEFVVVFTPSKDE